MIVKATKCLLVGGLLLPVLLPLSTSGAEAARIKLRWSGSSNEKPGQKAQDPATAAPSTPASASPRVINRVSDPEPQPAVDSKPAPAAVTKAGEAATAQASNEVLCIAGCYHR